MVRVIDLVHTDAEGVEQGVIGSYELDLAYGSGENDFELTLPIDMRIDCKSMVYVDGTEWGGIVRGGWESTVDDVPVYVATGETWHGRLASAYLVPDGDYIDVEGDANEAMGRVLDLVGLSGEFCALPEPSGIHVKYRFDRFADAYGGIRKMLASRGAKLKIAKDPGGKPTLYAVEIDDRVDTGEGDEYGYRIEWGTPVNHLICLGTGELSERIVIHLYADSDGNVSRSQSLFGIDERTELYDYSSADEETLVEEGIKRLKELQNVNACDLVLPEGVRLDVGDKVGVVSGKRSVSITAFVEKVIVSIGSDGLANIAYEIGDASASCRLMGGLGIAGRM